MAGCLQPIGNQPRGRLFPGELEREPPAPEFVKTGTMAGPGRIVAQIGNGLAVHVILAHRQRQQSMGEALRAFPERGYHVEREIERRLALAIEPPTGERGARA